MNRKNEYRHIRIGKCIIKLNITYNYRTLHLIDRKYSFLGWFMEHFQKLKM